MTDKRNLEKELEELADDLADRPTDDGDPPTKAELGVTADFIQFLDEDDAEPADVEDGEPSFIAFTENTDDD